ncbi:MAG TPA: phosphoribosylglycinamide formyltransferase [Steroidobacteraceae bacterium]|nr:phosphoribosylglycinamide formyltransferase [Steroidobacteraceae bacterium]
MNSEHAPRPIVILISGRGGNMRALIERSRDAGASYAVVKVFSDNPDAAGLPAARDLGVAAQALAGAKTADRNDYDLALAEAISDCSPSLIVLAGFMRILSARFVARFAGRILNIHPSLLPKFPGLHTHRRVLEAHEPQHGATVHFVTEQLDRGPPVIQARVAVTPSDDEASLAARVRAQEHRIYPLAVRWFCEGRLRYEDGRAWLDGRILQTPVLFTGGEPREGLG